MIDIEIKNDYYAYITTDRHELFSALIKSFTRKEKKYNSYWKIYQSIETKHYGLVDNGKVIKIKAGLVSFLCKSLKAKNIDYKLKGIIPQPENVKIITKLSDKITLRDYQEEAVIRAFNNCFCSIQLPTGTGKTACSASIIKTYLSKYFNRAALYVVPTIKLQSEAEETFVSCGIKVNTKLPIVNGCANILTYACLVRSIIDYKDRDKVGLLIYDECHHLKGDKNNKITHNYKKLQMCIGLSATLTSNIENKLYLKDLNGDDFKVFGCTGRPVYYKMELETIKTKTITPISIRLVDNNEHIYLSNDEQSDWHSLKNKVLMSEQRAKLVSKCIKQLVYTNKLKTICLLIPEVKWSQKFMLSIAEDIQDSNIDFILTYGGNKYDKIVDGELIAVKTEEEKLEIDKQIKDPNKITVFSATSYMYEGIDIVNLQAIINVYGGRSSTRIKQQVGRVVRVFEGKDKAYLYEIYDKYYPVLNYQLKSRLNIYANDYKADIKRLLFLDDGREV